MNCQNQETKSNSSMEVIKRNGERQRVSFDKVIYRIESLCWGLDRKYLDPIEVALETIRGFHTNIKTEEIDELSEQICAEKIIDHPDFNKLAARISISSLHKKTSGSFLEVIKTLYNHKDKFDDNIYLVSEKLYNIVLENYEKIEKEIDYNRDFLIDFFGFKTLEASYLIRTRKYPKDLGKVIERPQDMFMRVALGIHGNDLESAFETYHLMSQKYFIHATPTLFNAGTNYSQCSSCFLIYMDDSIDGISDVWKESALISKMAGGIGICLTDIRAKGSKIKSTNGVSDGIAPLCQTLNWIGRYVNQGGKRKGSIALYLEPWHADIFEFLELRTPHGNENNKARDIFLSLWVNDLFMKSVEKDDYWYLMCPNECKGLSNTYGEEFEKLYLDYVEKGLYRKKIKAQELWERIIDAQIETGMPYIAFKDNVNRKSNQSNVGVIKQSNLCCEIVEYTDNDETAVCNLASIVLPTYVENGVFNYDKLHEIAQIITKNLNKVIDINYYPSEKTKRSNFKHRPIGIGVQGLANVYNLLKLPFDSEEANNVNKKIFETIYHGSLTASNELAKIHGHYETFEGSPFSKGKLQWDLWGIKEEDLSLEWNELKESIVKYGTRNSLLTALMPTASTSQIMGCNEAFEPYTTNLYTRKTKAGVFIMVNENLVNELIKNNLWTKDIIEEFKYFSGSIQMIDRIPDNIKKIYKTAYEMKQSALIKQSFSRGPFIDQTQSMNLFVNEIDSDLIGSLYFYGWENGLKTGVYYLRTDSATKALRFGIDPDVSKRIENKYKLKDNVIDNETDNNSEDSDDDKICYYNKDKDSDEPCLMCQG